MGTASLLDKEITRSLLLLNDRQKKTVLTVVKTFAQEEQDWWSDKKYMAEMARRFKDMETGKVKGLGLDAVELAARTAFKNRNKKK